MAVLPLDDLDVRLIAALQVDGRAAAEKIASALGVPPRLAARRLTSLLRTGTVRVTAVPPRDPRMRMSVLRVKVLRGKVNAIAAALARRADVPFVDISNTGDEISAIITSCDSARGRLLFDQFAAADAVTAVTAQTVLRVHAEAHNWRLPVLDERARETLAPAVRLAGHVPLPADEAEARIREVLQADGRASAAAIAARAGVPATTVRRRLHAMSMAGTLLTSVLVDPARLGLHVDANLVLTVPPASMDAVARALAPHPAVHGVLATTGAAGLYIAVWLRDVDELYDFLTGDLARLGVTAAETVLVGESVKRPGWKHHAPAERDSVTLWPLLTGSGSPPTSSG